MVRKNANFKIIKGGRHVGDIHSGLGRSILDMEEHFGDSIGKVLSTLVREKHGTGEIVLDTDRGKFKIPEEKADNEEVMLLVGSLINGNMNDNEMETCPEEKSKVFGGMAMFGGPKPKKKIGFLNEQQTPNIERKPIQMLKIT